MATSRRTLQTCCQRSGAALEIPLRAALTGYTEGPELSALLKLLTARELGARLAKARARAADPVGD